MDWVLDGPAASFFASLNWVDALVIVVALAGAASGFLSGFVWQLLRIACLLAAFVVATRFHRSLAEAWDAGLSMPARMLVSYFVLLLAVLAAGYGALFLARLPLKAAGFRGSDRALGAALGLVKGLLLCGILCLVVLTYGGKDSAVRRSILSAPLGRHCARGARILLDAMPWWRSHVTDGA